ncbi:ABC transporter ATP-binding protein [Clostridium taeniosporum]|uniref:ABC transporter ATP-binding protein n=1 Tax=Clostridium taeniosporum TaxID=394958 RepID=A0A1D7XNT8_9CLOT|nr:ABC transporter ATP-binding protein [Clostridium taeniosporum]AOR24998.1 ABC transporter ATP-binding protein [Clostridium taeniosporum]
MLEIKNLTKNYKSLNVLNNFSLTINNNDFLGLVGPNGVGKTTLIKCITGICKIQLGDILVDKKSLFKYPYETKQKIGVCFQNDTFDRFFNIYDTLKFNAMYNGLSKNEAIQRTDEVLKLVKLENKAKCYGNELSGGMKKRFQIAQSIIHNPEIIILDEPSAGVDLQLKEDLYQLLLDLHSKENKTILLVSHYLDEIENLCNRAIFIKDCKLFLE